METGTYQVTLIVLTLLAGVTFRGHLHIISWKQPYDPSDLSFPPVRVVLVEYTDQLTFLEAHLILIGCFVVIHCNNLTHYRGKSRNDRENGWMEQNGTEERKQHIHTTAYKRVWMKECVCILHGWEEGVILPLLASSNLTLEEWNQPFLRFLPRAYKHTHLLVFKNWWFSVEFYCFFIQSYEIVT